MDATRIPYDRVPKSSALLLDYLYHYERLADFYGGSPFDAASYKAVSARVASESKSRRDIGEILEKQNRRFGSGEKTLENIERLKDPATFAVVTGQQVGLFSGPAFTLYKALTAVKLSEWLSRQGPRTVPVFWLATEDHDLEEVASTAVLDEEYNPVALSDVGSRPATRSPVGEVRFTEAVDGLIARLEGALPAGPSRDRLAEDLRSTYATGARWGDAFGSLMARLFSRWGVVLLDPLDEAVHRLAAPVYARAIRDAGKIREGLIARSRALESADYHAQVRVGEDSTTVFVTREGNRLPLAYRAAGRGEFTVGESDSVSLADLERLAQEHPISLTPNALLRPVVQDWLLPTVGYVAGPSELAYLAQSRVIYENLGRPQPVIYPRAGFTLVDRRTERLLEKYKLTVEDAWQGEEHLARKIASNGFVGDWSARLDRTEQDLAALLGRLREDVQSLDSTLADAVNNAQEKMTYQMERVKGKITRAVMERSELLGRHQQALARFLVPRHSLQEREVSGVYFLGRAGYELLDRLLEGIQVGVPDHYVMTY